MVRFERYNECEKVNDGLANLGFNLYEAMMEAIDDSLDANAKNIEISVFRENYTTLVDDENIESEKISYVIKDDGDGIEYLEQLFEFGEANTIVYLSKEEYENKNGVYHYGAISHINVGAEVIFCTKRLNGTWKAKAIKYDRFRKIGLIAEEKELEQDEIRQVLSLFNETEIEKGTILYVRGVDTKYLEIPNIEHSDEEDNNERGINELVETICDKLGLTYKWHLENRNDFQIKVNGNVVTPIDIFLQFKKEKESIDELQAAGAEETQELRRLRELVRLQSKHFATYNITLGQVLDRMNDRSLQRILMHHFDFLNNEDEPEDQILKESVKIELYAICLKFKDKINKKKIKPILQPSMENSGLYISRNNRYIGRFPYKIKDVFYNHNDFNYLRGEMKISPIFDKIFGIQVNKNKCDIERALEMIIKEEIDRDENLLGSSTQDKLKKAIHGIFNNEENKIKRYKEKIREIIGRFEVVNNNLSPYYFSNNFINSVYAEMIRLNLSDDDIIEKSEEELKDIIKSGKIAIKEIEEKYSVAIGDFINEHILFKTRVERLKNDKYLLTNNYEGLDNEELHDEIRYENSADEYRELYGVIEPRNEAEMFALFYNFNNIYKEIHGNSYFDFEVKDYSYKDGVDCLIEVDEDLYNDLRMPERFNGTLDDTGKIGNVLANTLNIQNITADKKYSLMEMKMSIPSTMHHPMRFVTHILCWSKNDIISMNDAYVQFNIDSTTDFLLVKGERRIKVYYLKEIIEDCVGMKFKKTN